MTDAVDIGNRFQILEELKRGGMGVVYRALDRERGGLAAIKMVRVADKQLIQSIRREIHALSRVRHPGIVEILAEGVSDGMPWYAMEFIAASSLLDCCQVESQVSQVQSEDVTNLRTEATGGRTMSVTMLTTPVGGRAQAVEAQVREPLAHGRVLKPNELQNILTLVRRICIPLSYMHGEGMVHLDLKPDNVLVRESGMPVILDFGLASSVRSQFGRDDIAAVSYGAGTVRYMAPEQINGELIDARTDIYALGCILFQLLTGRVPFPGRTSAEAIFGHLSVNPVRPSSLAAGIPAALDDLVLRMLEKQPRHRIGYAQDVARALTDLGAEGWREPCPAARSYIYRPQLAGRDAELQKLIGHYTEAHQGKSQILLLSGESGIGKTRLVGEFARAASLSDKPAEVHVGDFRPQGGPLHGFRRILQSIADHCRGLDKSEQQSIVGKRAVSLARYEPEFQWFVDKEDSAPDLLPDAARQLLFQDLWGMLHALGERQPLVLILDDVQWADELSMEFLEYLRAQAQLAPLRAAILATRRTGEPCPSVDEFESRPGVVSVRLGRLEPDAVRMLISDMLALPQVPSELSDALFQHSEGNPLFLTEYLLESVSERLIWRSPDGNWHAGGGAAKEQDYARIGLPSNVQDLIAHRLDGLSASARRIAETAAVLGQVADLDVVSQLFGGREDQLFDALDELRRRHMLEQRDSGALYFSHGKIREVTYAQIPDAQRTKLHMRVAQTLAAYPETHPAHVPAIIAEHFYAADEEFDALPHALAAGDAARGLYGPDEAERFYLRAIESLQKLRDTDTVTRTLMKLGLVYMAAFQADKARNVYEQAFKHWEQLRANNQVSTRSATLSVATGEPLNLDPGRTYDTDSAFYQRQLFSGLVEVDEETNVLPAIASRWQVSADGRTYTFFLRPDARWSDGTPLTAKHFVYAWRRNLSPTLGSQAAALLDVLENARAYRLGRTSAEELGVRAKGNHELEVRLAAPVGYLLQLLAHPIAAPLPSWLIDRRGNSWAAPESIVSNGAFKVTRWVHGQVIEMEHNDYDVALSRGNVRQLRCRIFHDYRDALKAYEEGTIDLLDMVSADAELVQELRSYHMNELHSVPMQSTSYLVFRADRAPFGDARVRRAFAMAIDRDRLADAARKVGAQPATGGFVPPGIPAHSPDLMPRATPEQARALLAEAGVTARDFVDVSWLHTHGIADPVFLEVLRDSWRRNLGIDIAPQILRWKDFQSRVDAGVADLVIGTWTADFADPDNFLRTVFHSSTGMNEPKWHSSEFDMLVDSAAARTDQGGRMNFYRAADRILVADEAAIVPLCYGREPVLAKPWVASFPRTASYIRLLKNCWIERSTRGGGAKA